MPWWVLLSSYHLIIMYLQIVFGLVFDERNMIGSQWDGHQLAIGDSTHRPVRTWCGFFALVLGPIWLAYNRHSSGSGTWMLLGSASSKKALLVYLLCHGCTRGGIFWCFEQLGHAKSIGDEFQQDLRAIGAASSSDNGCSTPYLAGFGGWAESTPKCPFLFAVHVADCMVLTSSKILPNELIAKSR